MLVPLVVFVSQSVYRPQAVRVKTGAADEPAAVDSVAVEAVREEWLVEDRWWAPNPLRRRYFELVLADGRNVVVFREANRWFLQRA
jgi:hypothetical protein